ncbi:MAG: alpha/beta hydrolase [Dorea sp.]
MAFLIILLFIIFVILVGSYYAYRIAFYNPPNRVENIYDLPRDAQYQKDQEYMISLIQEMDALPYEQVYISSFDGLKLAGRYYHVSDNSPLQIQMHGYHGMALRDFCGGNKLAREMGHNTLVIDERAHGKSEGHTITFGINERYDCLSWVQYACERFGNDIPIILCGVSMGASTVLMASELNLPPNVVGILADCPYSSPKEILWKVCGEDMHLPPKIVYPFLWLGAKIYGHFDFTKSSPVEAVKHAKVPVCIIHGEADYFVPTQMSHTIHQACISEKYIHTFPNAGHALSFIIDNERYSQVSTEFIHMCLNK